MSNQMTLLNPLHSEMSIDCPHGIATHMLYDPFGLLTVPYRERLHAMAQRYSGISSPSLNRHRGQDSLN
ncbi:MAG: hypothetical protein H0V35_12085 [Nitrospira sp.]|nr:hypothetical protein [Nitrospira sp.]